MSSRVKTGGNTLGAQSSIPAIRPFQLDPAGLGSISDSVNLFRGDVTLPLKLLSLPGRGGLNADAAIVYSSNVRKQTNVWNLDAPTGPVGLGWSLGFEMIALDNRSTAAPGDDQYFLVAGGASTPLFLTGRNSEFWSFELAAYQFWQIRYYPAREQWVIVKEDGNRWTYGGEVADIAASPVQYGVKWNGEDGDWVDATGQANGQSQFALAWNLASVETPFGDVLAFAYANDVPRIGGSSGLRYTRSSRLLRVTDPTGQSIQLFYEAKEFNATVREYQIPHVDPADPGFVAYQDRLETHYLSSMEVRNAASDPDAPNALLQTVEFDYEVVNASERPTDPDLFKRYLTRITMRTPSGLELPPITFSYYNREEDRGADVSTGSLREILYPQGGTITYEYSRTALSGTDHDLSVEPLGIPRVFFGPDYTVIAHYDGGSRGLEVRVYSWNGLWVEDPRSYRFQTDIDLETLSVEAQNDFFALSFHSDESQPRLFALLFHKDPVRFGRWITESGFTILPITPGTQGLMAAGEQFAVAITSAGEVMAKVWDPPTHSWIDRSRSIRLLPGQQYAMAAYANFLLLAQWDERTEDCALSLYYIDGAGRELVQGSLQEQTLRGVKWQTDSTPAVFWSPGASFASMTYLTRIGGDELDYQVDILQWDMNFRASIVQRTTSTVSSQISLPFAQSVSSGSVIGNLVDMWRYDGDEWVKGELLDLSGVSADTSFAYGADAAIAVGATSTAVSLFNPYALAWKNQNVTTPASVAPAPTIVDRFLTVGTDVYYRDNSGELKRIASLDPNLNPDSLSNRAPLFIAYEDASGNTHVFPVRNGGLVTEREIVLPNEKIAARVTGPGTHLVGASVIVTYTGPDLDNASTITLRQYLNENIDEQLVAWPVTQLSIDDGYNDNWGSTGAGREKQTLYRYDCGNVTVTPDGSVTEFAAATAIYGLPDSAVPTGGCYPPPARTRFGSSEFRYHNNRTALQNGFVLTSRAAGDAAIDAYSALSGLLFDRLDKDSDGAAVARQVNKYQVLDSRQSLDSGATVPLWGWYVKLQSVEDTFYESIIAAPADAAVRHLASGLVPDAVRDTLDLYAVDHDRGELVAGASPDVWAFFPDPESHVFHPVVRRSDGLTVSAAVIRLVTYGYSPATGLTTLETTQNTDSTGRKVTLKTTRTYAWQIAEYKAMKDAHILDAVAVAIKLSDPSNTIDATTGTPTEISLTTYKVWSGGATWAAARAFLAATAAVYQPASVPPVSFSGWRNDSLPDDAQWRMVSEVLQRLATGPVVEATDAQGRPTSSLLDRTGTFRYAELTNVSRSESLYSGFESYESLDRWSYTDSRPVAGSLVGGDAHTGRKSLRIVPDATNALQTRLTVDPTKRYVLSCWIKTPAGFSAGNGTASWVIRANGTDVATFPLEGSEGTWEYRSFAVSLNELGSAATGVDLRLVNHKTSDELWICVDDVFFVPLVCTAQANVFHPGTQDLAATVGFNGTTTRSLLDSYRRPVVDIGAARSATTVAVPYAMLPFHKPAAGTEFSYPQDDPDSVLSIVPTGTSPFANLVQGDAWTREWETTGQWDVVDATLVHRTTAANDAIIWKVTDGWSDYGARVSVRLTTDANGNPILPSGRVGISLGADCRADWTPSNGWQVTLKGTTVPAPAGLPFQTDWMLSASRDPVSGVTVVFFYADGRQLFARVVTDTIAGALTLYADDAAIGFNSIVAFRSPRLSTTYTDGSKKERQRQALTGETSIVTGTAYDPVGRAAIPAKSTPVANHLFGFVTDLITGFDPVSGVMSGRVADAWPADEGYPYARTDFYRSTLSLARAQGLPGADFAIIQQVDGGSLVDLNPHIVTYAYGTNAQGLVDGYPATEYFVQQTTDADGGKTLTVRTKLDEVALTRVGPLPDGSYATTQYIYDDAGRVVEMRLPNHFAPGAAADSFIVRTGYDFLAQPIRTSGPDDGVAELVTDRSGSVRFRTTYRGDAPPTSATIVYFKYDELQRKIEDGFFTGSWDRAFLTDKALNDPAWPDQSQPHTITQTLEYDGDGSDATLIGRLHIATTHSPAGNADVVQSFEYDAIGHVTATSQVANAFDGTPRVVQYTYNNADDVVALQYPDGAPLASLATSYDALGQLWRLGTAAGAGDIASYSYNPLGSLQNATLNAGGGTPITQAYTYNSPGWLLSARATLPNGATLLAQTLSYTEGGYHNAGYYSGQIASATYESGTDHTYRYQFDSLRQLRVAENTADAAASIGTNVPTAYDHNGNLTLLEQGGEERTYNYSGETDQVTSVTAGGTTLESLTYTDGGAVSSSSRLKLQPLEYDAVTGLPARIHATDPDQSLELSYTTDGTRAVKVLRAGSGGEEAARLYVRDMDGASLYESARTAAATNGVQYIYGPDGLQAMQLGSQRYTVLRDVLGSVRAVVDAQGTVVASFEYLPWGGVIRRGGSDPDITFYRYTGQELDPETGLYNYQARLYDPWLARFYAIDPAGYGISPYVYVGNDPVDLTDPSGQEPLTAFLIILAIGMIVGTAAGMITYAASYTGNFDVGKFFAYAAVGLVSGAAGAVVGYGVGVLTVAGLAAAGVATATNIGSGILVGGLTAAAEGAVASSLNQVGVNLVEGKRGADVLSGVGWAAALGAGIGAVTGATLGGVTGALNRRVAAKLADGDVGAALHANGQRYASTLKSGFRNRGADLAGAVQDTQATEILVIGAHGQAKGLSLSSDVGVVTNATALASAAPVGGFKGAGVNLGALCWGSRNGVARELANSWKVPVRAANSRTWTVHATGFTSATSRGHVSPEIRFFERFGRYETIYPSRLKTGWVALFGY